MTQQTWQHAHTRFPAVRRAMGRERTQLDDQQLEALLSERFGGVAAEDVENFMRDFQRVTKRMAKSVAPLAQGILRVVPGGQLLDPLLRTVAGTASQMGGSPDRPWHTPGSLTGPQRSGVVPASAPQPIPVTSPAVASPAVAAGTGSVQASEPLQQNPNAAAQLLMLLSRPETTQALLGLLMNRQRVALGNQQVPAAAFANALAEMASLAAEQAAPLPPRRNAYYFHADGTPRCNLADDAARAQLLFDDLIGADACQCSARGTSV